MRKKYDSHFTWRISQGALKKAREYGSVTVYVSVVGKSKVLFERPTGIKCFKNQFDSLAQKFIGEDCKIKNLELTRIKYQLEEAILSLETTGSSVLLSKSVKKTDDKIDIRPRTLKEMALEFIEFQRQKIRKEGQPKHLGNIEQSTFNTYTIRAEKVLFPYLIFKGLTDIQLHQVDSRFLESFDVWITNTTNSAGQSRGQLWATKNIKFVKQVLNYAVGCRYLTVSLANSYRTKKETIKPLQTLAMEDIELLETCEFMSKTEEEVLDSFMFCFETFLHFGDYQDLCENHIKTDRDGEKWIVKTRKKAQEENRQVMRVPLSTKALEMIEKYGGVENMPRRSNSETSTTLKIIAERVGLNKPIMFKMSRSSGISNAYNSKQMRGEDIAVVAGWESVRELRSYLKVDLGKLKNNFIHAQNTQNNGSMHQI